MNVNHTKVYHGTIRKFWEEYHDPPSTLHLTISFEDALNYAEDLFSSVIAYEQEYGDDDEVFLSGGKEFEAIVLEIPLSELRKHTDLEFNCDKTWGDINKEEDWISSLNACGSFSVTGDIEKIKHKFREVY